MPTPLLTPNPTLRSRGGGNALWICQIELNTAGTAYQAFSGATDVLGSTAGGWHNPFTMDKSPIDRNNDGSYKIVTSFLEDDVTRMNIMNALAPYDPLSANKIPDYTAEDGTAIVTSSGNSYDPTLPVFVIAKREASLAGKNRFFYAVVQFDRASKRPNDPKNWNTKDITINTINALGFVVTNPADASFTGVTAPTLSGHDCFGVRVSA